MNSVKIKMKGLPQLIGTTYPKLMNILREKKVLINTNGRNLPIQLYITKKWFLVDYININQGDFIAIVPTVFVTELGFKEIENIVNLYLYEEISFLDFQEQIKIEIIELLRVRKLKSTEKILTFETDNRIELAIQNTKNAEIFLKFDKINNKLWRMPIKSKN